MNNGSESSGFPNTILNGGPGVLSNFNRYGLPGAVIGVLFLINVWLMYVVVTTLQANTKAMSDFTTVVREMKETIKESR